MKLKSLLASAIAAVIFSCDTSENVPTIPADFEFASDMFMVRQNLEFSELPSGAVEYNWDFGNGRTAHERMPRYSYMEPGLYSVTLSVKAPGPVTHTATRDIRIGQNYLYELSLERPQNDYQVAEGETEIYIVTYRRIDELEEVDRVMGLTADLNNLPVSFDLSGVKFDAGPEYSSVRVYDASDDSLIAIHDQFEASSGFSSAESTGDYSGEINSSSPLGTRMTLRYREGE